MFIGDRKEITMKNELSGNAGNWNPLPRLSNERLREIKDCCGVYLLSKGEKEALVDECLENRKCV